MNDGLSKLQVTNNVLVSIFNNTGRILSPSKIKIVTTANAYIGYFKKTGIESISYGVSPRSIAISYSLAAYAWIQTGFSYYLNNPVKRANERGYSLV